MNLKLTLTEVFLSSFLPNSIENRGAALQTCVMSGFNHRTTFIYVKLVNYMYMCEALLICHTARGKQPLEREVT